MNSFLLAVSSDNKIYAVDAGADLGQAADGSIIHEVYNCPEEAQIEDAAYLLAKAPLKQGMYRHNFADLASGGSSCCGACS